MGGNLSAQNTIADSTASPLINDTLPGTLKVKGDTLAMPKEQGDIETTIKYSAKDSIRMDVVNKKVYLFGDARIEYGDITLTAALVSIDWENTLMTANALPDSTGKLTGVPVFTQAGEPYEAGSIKYNWKSKKGIISDIVTKQGEGFVTGDSVKRTEDAIYIRSAQYTTCNLSHPHFYINARKLKVIPQDKVVAGPFNLVISDVHTPLGFFLGFFPVPKKQKSGFIFPTFGMSGQRGLFLSRGGYFLAINEYLNFTVLGDAYSNGSFNVTGSSDYNVKYKYAGTLSFTGAQSRNSFALEDPLIPSFKLSWTHRTEMKRNRSFTGNVSVISQKFNQNNTFNPVLINQNTSTSNILYSKSFAGTPFLINVAARQDENIRGTKAVMNFTLPEITFAMSRITPFRKKTSLGQKWYEKINVGYTFNTKYFSSNLPIAYGVPIYIPPNTNRNAREGTDTINLARGGGFMDVLKNGQWGASQQIPISATFNLMKYFAVTPSVTFNQYFYDRYLDFFTDRNPVQARVVRGLTTNYDYVLSNKIATRVYGTYNFKSRRLLAIRHTAVPTVSYQYNPNFRDPRFHNYEQGYTNGAPNNNLYYNRFSGAPYGSTLTTEFNGLDFSLSNILEGKVRTRKDTSNQEKKIMLINNIGASGKYNFLGKNGLMLSTIAINATTTLFKVINITFGSTYDPYVYRKDSTAPGGQIRVNPKFLSPEIRNNSEFKRAQIYNLNLSANLNPKAFKPKTTAKMPTHEANLMAANPDMYLDFKIPWNLNIMYNLNYSRIGFSNANTTQSLSLSGDLTVTQFWKVAFTTGYDFIQKGIAYTTFTINRDLHCWQMSFNVVPFGTRQSYFFTLSAKSSILQDLKLNKRSPTYLGFQ